MSLDRAAVTNAIRSTKNLSAAARELGCSRRTLQNRMREYGLARGKSGRPKRRLYGKRRKAWAVGGALAAVGVVAGLALRGRASSST